MPLTFPDSFVWGTASAAHQTEGNNTLSDVWAVERAPGTWFTEPSGDACDSFHRYPEDIAIVADLGLDAYRFSLDWARIEPDEGTVSRAALAHYRAMVDTCLEAGVKPVVTLHHFTSPQWFAADGSFSNPKAVDRFGRFCEIVQPVLEDVDVVCTINEPNIVLELMGLFLPPTHKPDVPASRAIMLDAHRRAVQVLKDAGTPEVGLTLAISGLEVLPGGEQAAAEWASKMDPYLEATAADDFIGVQTYTDAVVGPEGYVYPGPDEVLAMIGWRDRPESLGRAVRRTHELTGKPLYVTENGIPTADDPHRVDYVRRALTSLHEAMADGADVRGYFYWSLLDSFEWTHGYGPRFGLVSVDPATFTRSIKSSGRWYGEVARAGRLP
jgi:beta-glucosidase